MINPIPNRLSRPSGSPSWQSWVEVAGVRGREQVRRANPGAQRGSTRGLSPWSSEVSTHVSQDGAPNGTCVPGTLGPRRGGRLVTLLDLGSH